MGRQEGGEGDGCISQGDIENEKRNEIVSGCRV